MCYLISYDDELIASVGHGDDRGIWKSSDGINWSKVDMPFDFVSRGRTIWDGDLYLGGKRKDTDVGVIYRYDGDTWEKVLEDGPKWQCFNLGFNDELYVGGKNAIWKSPNGTDWSEDFSFSTDNWIGLLVSSPDFNYLYALEGAGTGRGTRRIYRKDGGTWSTWKTFTYDDLWALGHHCPFTYETNDRRFYFPLVIRRAEREPGTRVMSYDEGSDEFRTELYANYYSWEGFWEIKRIGKRLYAYLVPGSWSDPYTELWTFDNREQWYRILPIPSKMDGIAHFGNRLWLAISHRWGGPKDTPHERQTCASVAVLSFDLLDKAGTKKGLPPREDFFFNTNGEIWKNRSISAGETTAPFRAYGYGGKTIYFVSDTAGNLTLEVQDPGRTWREYPGSPYSISADDPEAIEPSHDFLQARISFDTAATVTAWYSLRA